MPTPAQPSDSQKKIAFLLQHSLNPNLDDKTRTTANTLLGKALDDAKLPEKIQTM